MNKKTKKITYLIASLFTLFLLLFLFLQLKGGGPIETADYKEFEENGQLVLVTDYSPLDYQIVNDTIEGFSYDLIQLLQKYTGIRLEIVLESSLQKSIEGLENGNYHIIARSIPINSELKERILFTNPIIQNKLVLVQRKQEYNDSIAPIRSLLDLAGKTLHIPKNSPAILRIKNLSKEIGDTIHFVENEIYGEEHLALMVADGEIDFTVCDEMSARNLSQDQKELDIETKIGFTQLEAWAVDKSTPILLDSLNSWLERAKKTPKFAQLYKAYFAQ